MNDTLLAVTVPPLMRTLLPVLLLPAIALKFATPESITRFELLPVTFAVPVALSAPPATWNVAPPVEILIVLGVNVAPGSTRKTPAVTPTTPVSALGAASARAPGPALVKPFDPVSRAASLTSELGPSGLTVIVGAADAPTSVSVLVASPLSSIIQLA